MKRIVRIGRRKNKIPKIFKEQKLQQFYEEMRTEVQQWQLKKPIF